MGRRNLDPNGGDIDTPTMLYCQWRGGVFCTSQRRF